MVSGVAPLPFFVVPVPFLVAPSPSDTRTSAAEGASCCAFCFVWKYGASLRRSSSTTFGFADGAEIGVRKMSCSAPLGSETGTGKGLRTGARNEFDGGVVGVTNELLVGTEREGMADTIEDTGLAAGVTNELLVGTEPTEVAPGIPYELLVGTERAGMADTNEGTCKGVTEEIGAAAIGTSPLSTSNGCIGENSRFGTVEGLEINLRFGTDGGFGTNVVGTGAGNDDGVP
jgi:hypothetical protein